MGRYEPLLIDPYELPEESGNYLSMKDKFSKLVLSATDTEMTHYTLHDMLPDDKYFRFNPYLSGMYGVRNLEKTIRFSKDSRPSEQFHWPEMSQIT